MEQLKEKQEPVFELHELENSPLALIHEATEDWWDIACGKCRAGERFKTREEAEKRIKKTDWNLVTMVCFQILSLTQKEQNND